MAEPHATGSTRHGARSVARAVFRARFGARRLLAAQIPCAARGTALEILCSGTFTTLLGAGCSSNAPRAFVSNEDSNDITVIKMDTFEVRATIPVGKRPRGARISPDGAWLYVALISSAASPQASRLGGLHQTGHAHDMTPITLRRPPRGTPRA